MLPGFFKWGQKLCDRNKRKAVTRIEKIYVRTYTERKVKR